MHHAVSNDAVPFMQQNQMTREVVAQLRRISGQQSKISRARGQLSVFRQVPSRCIHSDCTTRWGLFRDCGRTVGCNVQATSSHACNGVEEPPCLYKTFNLYPSNSDVNTHFGAGCKPAGGGHCRAVAAAAAASGISPLPGGVPAQVRELLSR